MSDFAIRPELLERCRWLIALAAVFGFLALPVTAGAATLNVCPTGCTYSSIRTAVIAASAGDTVNVAAGTYNETQVLVDKPLTLHGAGVGVSIIDGAAGRTSRPWGPCASRRLLAT